MKIQLNNRFERGILKVIALIGLIRFSIALLLSDPVADGYSDLYLDIATALVFLAGVVLVHFKADNKWIIGFFFVPLILLLWVSFYFNNGLASSGEINAYAIAIILCLTVQGRLPWIFIGIFLLGVFVVLYFVEQENLASLDTLVISKGTTTLLLITLANIWMTFHAKNVFDKSRVDLSKTNKNLKERTEEIQEKREELTKQNTELIRLKNELEVKVLERTEKLQTQRISIEEYLKLTLTELIAPYEKTVNAIKQLENPESDEMITMIVESGIKLEVEVEKLRTRLLYADE